MLGTVGLVLVNSFDPTLLKINYGDFLIIQVLNVGHWLKGAALKTGEEEEILNTVISRHNPVTKHMGDGSEC